MMILCEVSILLSIILQYTSSDGFILIVSTVLPSSTLLTVNSPHKLYSSLRVLPYWGLMARFSHQFYILV